MPWSNIPKEKWPQMEKCVNDLKAKGKSEESANSICYTSIMGSKKMDMPNLTFNINLNDYWKSKMNEEIEEEIEEMEGGEEEMTESVEKAVWTTAYQNDLPDSSFAYISEGGKKDSEGKTTPRSLRHLPYKDADGKPDAAHVRNALARLPQTDISAEAKASAHAKLVVAAKELNIEVSEEKEEKKIDAEGGEENMAKEKEEESKEMQDCMSKYMKDGKSMAEARKQCMIDLKEEDAEEEKGKEESEEKVSGVEDMVKQVLTRLDEIEVSLKKEDESASAEGAVEETKEEAPVVEAAPEVPAQEAVVEEAPAEEKADDSSEGTDKIAKVNDSLTKLTDSIEKMTQKFEDFEKRINALEEQPVPSKVVSPKVVIKGEVSEDSNPRLGEIKTELLKLEEMKNKNVEQYQKERAWEKAFDLIAERDQLIRG